MVKIPFPEAGLSELGTISRFDEQYGGGRGLIQDTIR
jgi:hypothetical protein